jgi:hypothetical protein
VASLCDAAMNNTALRTLPGRERRPPSQLGDGTFIRPESVAEDLGVTATEAHGDVLELHSAGLDRPNVDP